MVPPKLHDVVANALRIDPSTIVETMAFGVTPEWDSLNHVALMMALEAEYNVTISDDEVVELTDLGAIERFVASRSSPIDVE